MPYFKRIRASQLACTPWDAALLVEIEVGLKLDAQLHDLFDFQKRASVNVTPVLTDARDYHPQTCTEWLSAMQRLKHSGLNHWVFAADEDGVWQRALSPRLNKDSREHKGAMLSLLLEAERLLPNMTLALVVEELCPNGIDASMSLEMVRQLSSLGIRKFIASSGTDDFGALKWRRRTHLKSEEQEASSDEIWLSSAMWWREVCGISVLAQGCPSDPTKALNIACELGLSGVVDLSDKRPSFG